MMVVLITASLARTKLYISVSITITGRYLCWWTISPRVYYPPSSQIDMIYKMYIYIELFIRLKF